MSHILIPTTVTHTKPLLALQLKYDQLIVQSAKTALPFQGAKITTATVLQTNVYQTKSYNTMDHALTAQLVCHLMHQGDLVS